MPLEEQTMANSTSAHKPPMQSSGEANSQQLELAKQQGQALQKALDHMVQKVAHDGGETAAGEYLVAYAVEEAEGMYELQEGELVWQDPEPQNVHVEVAVRDGADGRFIPGLTVYATLFDESGSEIGTHQQPFLWHPWLYHYGRNWQVPGDGTYRLKVKIEPPTFMRHDKKNGKRFAEPVEVEFANISIKTGQD